MNKTKLSTIINGTVLSVLVFFSVSFITVLTQLNPLRNYKHSEVFNLDIGFPFTYHSQFWISGSTIPNSGWTINNLFYDCFITWVVVTGLYYLTRRAKKQQPQTLERLSASPHEKALH